MHTSTFKRKPNILNSAFLAILLAVSGHASAGTIPANCRALVEMRNDLWFIKPDSSPPFQVTHDGKMKDVIAGVSPDGKMIAYMDQMPDDFTQDNLALIDLNGTLLSKTNLHTEGFVISLKWANANLLQVGGHVSPSVSSYQFVQVPSGGLHPVFLRQLPPIEGISCTSSPNNRDVACISDFYSGGISLNGNDRDIYDTPDSFISATELQTLDIAVGSAVTTTTVPPFKLEVLEIVDNQPKLKVTVTEDYSLEEYIQLGDTMSVPVGGDLNDDIPPTIYGFTATIKHPSHEPSKADDASKDKGDKKTAVVTVRVLKSLTGRYALEGDLAWSPDGRRIAAVEKNDLGQRWLILLNSKALTGKDGEKGEDHDTDGNVDAREPLPIKGPIHRIDFISDTHIRVEGETQIFEQDIPAYGKLRDATKYTITSALPKQFSIDNMFVPIYGWVCQ